MLAEVVKNNRLRSEHDALKLIISDAVHIAIMKNRSIVDLASNDSDFERVAGINLWKP